jgi:F0F1-type ATP synthase membrane subunit b/b'
MADWVMPLFTIVVAVALLMETLVIAVMFIAFRRLTGRIEKLTDRVQGRVFPLISQFQLRFDEVQPRISDSVTQASDLVHSARKQAEQTDRMITETTDRLRIKLVQADQTIAGSLELIEDTGSKIRRAVLAPVRSLKALTAGIQTGVNVYRSRSRESTEQIDLSEEWIAPDANPEAYDPRTQL